MPIWARETRERIFKQDQYRLPNPYSQLTLSPLDEKWNVLQDYGANCPEKRIGMERRWKKTYRGTR